MKIEELISAVYVRNSLWDQNDDCHRNRFVLDKLWDEVAAQMGSTREAVRSKWKTLRDTYRKELQKRAKLNENETGNLARSSNWTLLRNWKYFTNLSFLRDQFEAGRNGKFEMIDSASDSQPFKRMRSESPTIPVINQSEYRKEPDTQYTSTEYCYGSTPQNFRGIFLPLQKQQPPYSKVEGADVTSTEMKPEQIKNVAKIDNAEDYEDMHFFKSLLPHVKQLSPQQKMLLRMKLQGVVYDFVYTQRKTEDLNPTDTEYSIKHHSE
ncbi:uncharacterized protein [Eurosta solidaginis]|uniref:uncharacterized protein isoform X1 n=1 Tax=Eurosta solidaginis TaxID=178769 RepID=UPI003531614D